MSMSMSSSLPPSSSLVSSGSSPPLVSGGAASPAAVGVGGASSSLVPSAFASPPPPSSFLTQTSGDVETSDAAAGAAGVGGVTGFDTPIAVNLMGLDAAGARACVLTRGHEGAKAAWRIAVVDAADVHSAVGNKTHALNSITKRIVTPKPAIPTNFDVKAVKVNATGTKVLVILDAPRAQSPVYVVHLEGVPTRAHAHGQPTEHNAKCHAVGRLAFAKWARRTAGAYVRDVQFHPTSDTHVAVLLSSGVLALFDVGADADAPPEIALKLPAPPSPNNASNGGSSLCNLCFADTTSNDAGFDAYTAYITDEHSNIYQLCPFGPRPRGAAACKAASESFTRAVEDVHRAAMSASAETHDDARMAMWRADADAWRAWTLEGVDMAPTSVPTPMLVGPLSSDANAGESFAPNVAVRAVPLGRDAGGCTALLLASASSRLSSPGAASVRVVVLAGVATPLFGTIDESPRGARAVKLMQPQAFGGNTAPMPLAAAIPQVVEALRSEAPAPISASPMQHGPAWVWDIALDPAQPDAAVIYGTPRGTSAIGAAATLRLPGLACLRRLVAALHDPEGGAPVSAAAALAPPATESLQLPKRATGAILLPPPLAARAQPGAVALLGDSQLHTVAMAAIDSAKSPSSALTVASYGEGDHDGGSFATATQLYEPMITLAARGCPNNTLSGHHPPGSEATKPDTASGNRRLAEAAASLRCSVFEEIARFEAVVKARTSSADRECARLQRRTEHLLQDFGVEEDELDTYAATGEAADDDVMRELVEQAAEKLQDEEAATRDIDAAPVALRLLSRGAAALTWRAQKLSAASSNAESRMRDVLNKLQRVGVGSSGGLVAVAGPLSASEERLKADLGSAEARLQEMEHRIREVQDALCAERRSRGEQPSGIRGITTPKGAREQGSSSASDVNPRFGSASRRSGVVSLAPQASPSSSLTTLPSQLRAALNSVGGPTRVGASVSADIALRADLDEAARLTATAARVATLVEATLGGGGGGGGDGA